MSSKIGLLISMLFFSLFFFLSIDVLCIQYFYNDLDYKSVLIGYDISRNEELSDEFINSLEEKYNVTISDMSSNNPEFGDVVKYTISRVYRPIIVSRDDMVLAIKRGTVIGYY